MVLDRLQHLWKDSPVSVLRIDHVAFCSVQDSADYASLQAVATKLVQIPVQFLCNILGQGKEVGFQNRKSYTNK